jgi:hypothetical protein
MGPGVRSRRWSSGRAGPSLVGMPLWLALLATLSLGCAAAPPAPDEVCLGVLRARGVAFTEGPALKGVRTPVTLDGERFSPRLTPRGTRPAQMDCQLAVALVEARPIFQNLGITQLDYSAAYDYRNRRHSNQLSQHAAGLAIDVHAFHGDGREYLVARTFERRRGAWQALQLRPGWFEDCVGRPRTAGGRTLRRLACRIRLEEAFRVILTPDDNRDHHDHFHIEARPDVAERLTAQRNS